MKYKQLAVGFFCAVLSMTLVGCKKNVKLQHLSDTVGLSVPAVSSMEWVDTHGGLYGDGTTFCKVVLDDENAKNLQEQIEQNASWHPFPLSENVYIALYGGEKDAVRYTSIVSSEDKIPVMPKVLNGYWYFYDRHDKSTDPQDDAALFERYSYHFDIAVYDPDQQTLYTYMLDN